MLIVLMLRGKRQRIAAVAVKDNSSSNSFGDKYRTLEPRVTDLSYSGSTINNHLLYIFALEKSGNGSTAFRGARCS